MSDQLFKRLESATTLLCEQNRSLKADNARLRERNDALESENRSWLEIHRRLLSQIDDLKGGLLQDASQLRSWKDEQKQNRDWPKGTELKQ
jgi:FtsZ-binding cell division protein ZapB